MTKKPISVFWMLGFLTFFFCIFLLSLNVIDHWVTGLGAVIQSGARGSFNFLYKPLLLYLFVQLGLGAVFVVILWYAITLISEYFALSNGKTVLLAILLWCSSITAIMFANAYYVPHSLFTRILLSYFFHDALQYAQLKIVVGVAGMICLVFFMVALWSAKRSVASVAVLSVVVFLGLVIEKNHFKMPSQDYASAAKPNIIIISFDALNPKALSFFKKTTNATPHFDEFLKNGIVFSEAYTPEARTFPSWAGILSGKYPLHNTIREDNSEIDSAKLGDTLASRLRQNGYETIFAADDNRFSSINKEFGFDSVIGDKGDVIDYLLCDINDYPLSNLLVPTRVGKWLFPYNYGNHGAAFTYDPDNFLRLITDKISQRDNKPLFLAMHFNITGFPWQYFNDAKYQANVSERYSQTIRRADKVFAALLANLKQAGLLQHAIVVLISDHGLTLGQPNERNILENLYEGNSDIKTLSRDTQIGYGGDILSLKQMQPLLVFNAYGVDIGPAHIVPGRSLLLDIAPTLLDLLKLPTLLGAEGISLKPYFARLDLTLSNQRPIFFESAYITNQINQDEINVGSVVTNAISLFQINPVSGLVLVKPSAVAIMQQKKQRGILQGDWLLAYFPASWRYKLVTDNLQKMSFEKALSPAYAILLNVKTGAWTTEFDTALAKNSPLQSLMGQLHQFYCAEMDSYAKSNAWVF